ncbi:hypothetical protein HK096_002787, partial [Nowakowskiella sp. JEL0078]
MFNADETALFWRQGPTSSLNPVNVDASGSKADKHRVSPLLCTSAMGEKRKIL